ncbi:hypothetical protein HUS23_05820 [Ectothiorhodospiraceae bacterium 2226]|nr:hypothetical protein HUS23_05820 [Ectothiorhodospiraceae bacterium 2226]
MKTTALRSAITQLLPPKVREDYRATRGLARAQQAFRARFPTATGLFLRRLRIQFAPKRTVLFYPQLPIDNYVIYKLCGILGYKLVNDPRRRHDVAVHLFSSTRAEPGDVLRLPKGGPLINGRLRDTSKTAVAAAFERSFGYALKVDPTRYEGKAVEKAEDNGVHDARVVDCPLPPEAVRACYTYQKAVDNTLPDGGFLDYRVPVHGYSVPLVFCKHVMPGAQFQSCYSRVDVRAPHQVFDREELAKIVAFARDFGLEFGELDVLRDRTDGRIYIVDVNNVPVGPRAQSGELIKARPGPSLSEVDRKTMLQMAASFDQLVEESLMRAQRVLQPARQVPLPKLRGPRATGL